jgi:ferritin-like metal-binding protein YciE
MQGEQFNSPLEKLFVNMLREMYYVEKRSAESLATLQSEATTEELQDAFEDHRFISEKQAARLEKIFSLLGMEPQEKECAAIDSMIAEAEEMIAETQEGSMTRDVALIISAQKVEHYEIACYGSLVELALTLGNDKVAFILEKTLLEEEDTDQLLTDIAQCEINPLADEEPMELTAEYEEEEITA